jgi:hypothetical protein
MSRSTSALTVVPLGRNEKLTLNNRLVSVETAWLNALRAGRLRMPDESVYEPEASSVVSDLVEISAGEMSQRVPVVPNTDFHLRVEFEDGRDVLVSFDGRVKDSLDDRRTYAEAQLSNWHIDGKAATPVEVDALFTDAVDQLEEWLIEEPEVTE